MIKDLSKCSIAQLVDKYKKTNSLSLREEIHLEANKRPDEENKLFVKEILSYFEKCFKSEEG